MSQSTTTALITCTALWDTRTCAARSKRSAWLRMFSSTPFSCRCSRLAWAEIILVQVNTTAESQSLSCPPSSVLTLSWLPLFQRRSVSWTKTTCWSPSSSVLPWPAWCSSSSWPTSLAGRGATPDTRPSRARLSCSPEATGWLYTLAINHCSIRLNTRRPPRSLFPSSLTPPRRLSVPFFALVINMKRFAWAAQCCHWGGGAPWWYYVTEGEREKGCWPRGGVNKSSHVVCTIYDFCERNFEGLWDLKELLLLLSSCVRAFGEDRFYWCLPEEGLAL